MGPARTGKKRGRPTLYHTAEEKHEAELARKRKDYARYVSTVCLTFALDIDKISSHRHERRIKMKEYYDIQAEKANRRRRVPLNQEEQYTLCVCFPCLTENLPACARPYNKAAVSTILRDARLIQGAVRALLECRRIPVWAKGLVLSARNCTTPEEAQLQLDHICKTLEAHDKEMSGLGYRMFVAERVPCEDDQCRDFTAISEYVKCSFNAILDITYTYKDGTLQERYAAGECYFQTYDFA